MTAATPSVQSFGSTEITATTLVQFLPRCPRCHAAHPLATGHSDTENCPRCGIPLSAAEAGTLVAAVVTDWRARLGLTLIKIGRALRRLAGGSPR